MNSLKEGLGYLNVETEKKTVNSPDYWGRMNIHGEMTRIVAWKLPDGSIKIQFGREESEAQKATSVPEKRVELDERIPF